MAKIERISDSVWDSISSGEQPSVVKFCRKDCRYFQRPGTRRRRPADEGKCKADKGAVVFAGATICNQKVY